MIWTADGQVDRSDVPISALMHFSFADSLNLVSTLTLIGAFVFTGLQVRAANRARLDQAAVTVLQTA
jgi:hypothetical protein